MERWLVLLLFSLVVRNNPTEIPLFRRVVTHGTP
jgi:hypothetical protein